MSIVYTGDMLAKEILNKKIGEKIEACRKEHGDSQTALAQVLKFDSPTAVSLIESGKRSLKIRDLIILCQLYQKDYRYFIGNPSDYKNVKL